MKRFGQIIGVVGHYGSHAATGRKQKEGDWWAGMEEVFLLD